MPRALLVQGQLLPTDAVALGRFVVDIASPHRAFHDPFPDRTLQSTVHRQHDFRELERKIQASRVGARLADLVGVFKQIQNDVGTRVSARMAATYALCQWDAVFKEACALSHTRKWLEDAIEDDRPVYFIVGFRTLVNPSAEEQAIASRGNGVQLQLPLSMVAQPQIAPALLSGNTSDPAIWNSDLNSGQMARSFSSQGEHVYAIEYCKVNFKWYSSRKIDSSSLGKNKWKIQFGVRGNDEDEEEDVLEAVLSQELDLGEDDDLLLK